MTILFKTRCGCTRTMFVTYYPKGSLFLPLIPDRNDEPLEHLPKRLGTYNREFKDTGEVIWLPEQKCHARVYLEIATP